MYECEGFSPAPDQGKNSVNGGQRKPLEDADNTCLSELLT